MVTERKGQASPEDCPRHCFALQTLRQKRTAMAKVPPLGQTSSELPRTAFGRNGGAKDKSRRAIRRLIRPMEALAHAQATPSKTLSARTAAWRARAGMGPHAYVTLRVEWGSMARNRMDQAGTRTAASRARQAQTGKNWHGLARRQRAGIGTGRASPGPKGASEYGKKPRTARAEKKLARLNLCVDRRRSAKKVDTRACTRLPP